MVRLLETRIQQKIHKKITLGKTTLTDMRGRLDFRAAQLQIVSTAICHRTVPGHTIISPNSQFKTILRLTKSFRVELCENRSKYQHLVTEPNTFTINYYISSQSSSEQSCCTTKGVFSVSSRGRFLK